MNNPDKPPMNPSDHIHPEQPSISVVTFENEAVERPFVDEISKSYRELKALLPGLPQELRVAFGTNYAYGETGATGSALAADLMQIGIDPDREDRSKQLAKIRSIVFHEGFHISQGFYLKGRTFSALESAVYEGCGTVFERDYAGSEPKWGNYQKEDGSALQRWYDEMQGISAEQYFEPSGETWRKWAFYDPETDESWRVYKVGTWLVDTVLKERGMDILELGTKTADEILGYLE